MRWHCQGRLHLLKLRTGAKFLQPEHVNVQVTSKSFVLLPVARKNVPNGHQESAPQRKGEDAMGTDLCLCPCIKRFILVAS